MRLSLIRNIKFGPQVKEVRLHLCQTGAESQGARLVEDFSCYAMQLLNCLRFDFQGIRPESLCQYQAGQPEAFNTYQGVQRCAAKIVDAIRQQINDQRQLNFFNENISNLQTSARKLPFRSPASHLTASSSCSKALSKFVVQCKCNF